MTQLRIELRPLHHLTPAASSAYGLHGELKESTVGGGGTSQLFPPVIGAVQQSILILLFVTKMIPVVLRHDGGKQFPAPDAGFYRLKTT